MSPDIWESVLLAAGKQENSLTLAISTPAVSEESVMWTLVSENRETPDPDFYFREYTSDPTHPWTVSTVNGSRIPLLATSSTGRAWPVSARAPVRASTGV